MSVPWQSLIEFSSSALEPPERDAVLGDLIESKSIGPRTLLEVIGLVARRQALLWKRWQAWLALLGLAAICRPLIHAVFEVSAPIFWNIRTYWRVGSFYESGLTAGEELFSLLTLVAGVILWSWTSGLVLAALSRRTAWITGLVCLLLTSYQFPIGVYYTGKLLLSHSDRAPFLVLMLIVQAILHLALFVIPAILGFRAATLSFTRTCLLGVGTIVIASTAIWTGGWGAAAVTRWAGGVWDASPGWAARLLSYGILCWPVLYISFIAKQPRARRRLPEATMD